MGICAGLKNERLAGGGPFGALREGGDTRRLP